MPGDRNTTLTHVYGIVSLIPALVGLVWLFKGGTSWAEYTLFGAGWGVAVFFGIMLYRAFGVARADGETIGRLTAELAGREEQIARLSGVLEYIASPSLSKRATPRRTVAAVEAPEGKP